MGVILTIQTTRQVISRYLKGYSENQTEMEDIRKEFLGLVNIRNQDNKKIMNLDKRIKEIEEFFDNKYGK